MLSTRRRPYRGRLRDCENFADGSFAALILTNAACTRVKPGPTITRLAFCFIPIANYSLLSSINQGTVLIKAKFILYENTLHKIVFTIFRDTNYVFRWILILFKCSRSFVDFIYIWDTKLVINLCKKLMNDNLYQSKAGVFTLVGSCGLPSPSHPQDKSELWWCIVIVGWRPAPLCSGASLACLSIGVQQLWAMYGRSHFLFLVFHLKHSALGYQISELLTNQYCLPQWPSGLDGKISS